MSSVFTPFSGSSRTVAIGQQTGGVDQSSLLSTLFSEESRDQFAKECKLGLYTNLRSSQRFNYVDLVPQAHGSKVLNLFRTEYEKGRIPSSGVLSIPRVLVFLVRTSSASEGGSVTLRLVDLKGASNLDGLEAVDGTQEATVPISDLPAIVCFSPSYDCPMEMLGNRPRCFGLVSQLDGVSSSGTTVMSHAYWSASFRTKPNNYVRHVPKFVYVTPFERLVKLNRKQLKNYIKGISNQSIDFGYLMGKTVDRVQEVVDITASEEDKESLTSDAVDGGDQKVVKTERSATAKSVAGLPVSRNTLIFNR
ncbi:3a protein [Cassia yellow blotch virus]|uniref:Movement protein n=1 Tax=Cassia yellow blotch virus TaxID=300879 RepID=Q50L54_9BROM|nr:3a protein [Cassia yellow blotch virus]BAD98318.1 3a protein [Cassia yellow blotch virus]